MRFVNMCTMNTVDALASSNFLAAKRIETYVRYFTARKMVINHKAAFLRFTNLDRDATAAKTLKITLLDDQSLFLQFHEDILSMIQAANAFTNNEQNLQ